MAQVVGAELHLEAVCCGLSGCIHHPGVVDQQVDALVVRLQLCRGGAHRRQRGQVKLLKLYFGAGGGLGDACRRLLALVEVAHSQHHVCTMGGKRCGGLESKSGAGPRDDGGPAGLVRNVGGSPFGHEGSSLCFD